jgi:hypothetical protein
MAEAKFDRAVTCVTATPTSGKLQQPTEQSPTINRLYDRVESPSDQTGAQRRRLVNSSCLSYVSVECSMHREVTIKKKKKKKTIVAETWNGVSLEDIRRTSVTQKEQ